MSVRAGFDCFVVSTVLQLAWFESVVGIAVISSVTSVSVLFACFMVLIGCCEEVELIVEDLKQQLPMFRSGGAGVGSVGVGSVGVRVELKNYSREV